MSADGDAGGGGGGGGREGGDAVDVGREHVGGGAGAARRRPRCVTTAPLRASTHTAGRTARSAAASAVSASTSRNVSSDGSYTRAKSTCEVSGSFWGSKAAAVGIGASWHGRPSCG